MIGALADRFGCRIVTVLGTFLFAGRARAHAGGDRSAYADRGGSG